MEVPAPEEPLFLEKKAMARGGGDWQCHATALELLLITSATGEIQGGLSVRGSNRRIQI